MSQQALLPTQAFNTGFKKNEMMGRLLFFCFLIASVSGRAQLGKSEIATGSIATSHIAADSVALNDHLGGFCTLLNFCGTTLPIHILQLEGRRVNTAEVKLTWIASNEAFNAGFELQRSDNETQSFNQVAFIKATPGTGAVQNYAHNDANSNSGVSYYRIRQTDADGRFRYSNIVRVTGISKKLTASVFPNPVASKATLTVSIPNRQSQTFVQLTDMSGKVLRTQPISAGFTGSFEINWFQQLSGGSYLLRVYDETESVVMKVVVQR